MIRKVLVPIILAVAVVAVAFYFRPVTFVSGILYTEMWFSGSSSRYITVRGIRIHYDVAGPATGPVAVLVHGLSGHAEDWESMFPYLVKAGYRVYMPDLPGFGRSDHPADFSYSVRDQAAVISGFLDALNLQQVDLTGWSMGGWIVQLVALDHPARLHRLILVDTGGLHEAPTWNTNLFAPTTISELDALKALLTPNPTKIPDFVSRDVVRNSIKNSWVVHRALKTMLSGDDTTDGRLPQLRMPVLIVWDTGDLIFPLGEGYTLHKLIPQSQLDLISGCGHLLVIECADKVGPKIISFLQQ